MLQIIVPQCGPQDEGGEYPDGDADRPGCVERAPPGAPGAAQLEDVDRVQRTGEAHPGADHQAGGGDGGGGEGGGGGRHDRGGGGDRGLFIKIKKIT